MPGGVAIVIGGRRGPRVRRYLLPTAVVLAIVIAALVVTNFLFQRATAYDVPSGKRPAFELRAGERALELGPSRAARRFGLWVLHLGGDEHGVGWARGRLLARIAGPDELVVRRAVALSATGWLGRTWESLARRWHTRGLPEGLADDYARELAGLARGLREGGAGGGPGEPGPPSYRDLVYEQVAFERGAQPVGSREADPRAAHRLSRSSFAFAGRGASDGGHTWVGASLRLGNASAAIDPVVEFVRLDGALPYAAVTWPAQLGALAGINQAGIVVAVVPARSRQGAPGGTGEPVAGLARSVLAHAATLAEAQAILRTRKPLSTASFLIASGREGDAVVVERTPRRLATRRADAAGGVWAAGHFVAPEFESDGDNDRMRRYGGTGARHQRLGELVSERRGVLDAGRALEILRDRRLPTGAGAAELPLGHPGALLSASARPVLFDASALVMWVGEGPGALGPLRAFDVRHELAGPGEATGGAAPPPDLPADALLDAPAWRDLQVADAALADAVRLARARKRRLAVEALRRVVAFAPRLPGPRKLLGDLLRAQGAGDAARAEYQTYLDLAPPFLDEVEEVQAYLGKM